LKKVEGSYQSVLLVGHEPDLSQLLSVLLSGSLDLGITMKKGGLAKLTCMTADPGSAALNGCSLRSIFAVSINECLTQLTNSGRSTSAFPRI
jgi:phosphohistidine phosphatase SixA